MAVTDVPKEGIDILLGNDVLSTCTDHLVFSDDTSSVSVATTRSVARKISANTKEAIGCGPRYGVLNRAEVHQHSEKAQRRMKKYFDRGTRVKLLEVNDLVLKLKEVALGLDQKYNSPYKIIEITAPDTYKLKLVSDPKKVTVAHANKLKKYYTNDVCAANSSETNGNMERLNEDVDIKKYPTIRYYQI